MRSLLVLVALATSSLAVYIHPLDIRQDPESTEAIVEALAASNNYGAPVPPSSAGSNAGWYYGDSPGSADTLPWLKDSVSTNLVVSRRKLTLILLLGSLFSSRSES